MTTSKKGTPDYVDVHVGKKLRIKRSLMGISQERLASLVNITFQQIQKYERGINRVSASRLYQFSKILNIPVQYFFEDLENQSNNNNSSSYGFADNEQDNFMGEVESEDIMSKKETIDLIRAYYDITDENIRRDALKLLKSMAAASKSS